MHVHKKLSAGPFHSFSVCATGAFNALAYGVQFSLIVPQMPLPHLNNPLYSELGKISSFEESHEDAAEDSHGAPGIRSHNLFGNKCLEPIRTDKL